MGTYASHARVAEALAQSGGQLDLLICDEAHRTTGATTKRDAQPLFDAALPARHRLFLTATPRLLGGNGDVTITTTTITTTITAAATTTTQGYGEGRGHAPLRRRRSRRARAGGRRSGRG